MQGHEEIKARNSYTYIMLHSVYSIVLYSIIFLHGFSVSNSEHSFSISMA